MKNYLVCGNYTKAQFLSKVDAATEEFAKIWNTKPDKCADDVNKVKKALAGLSLGNKAKSVIDALIGAFDKDKKGGGKFLTFVPFACVVPTRNRNNHRYALNEPVIMIRGQEGKDFGMYGMRADGSVGCEGNELPRLRKSLRPATYTEIRKITDSLFS